MEYADLSEAHLEDAKLRGAHLEHADLHKAHLEKADLRHIWKWHTYRRHIWKMQNYGWAHLENADLWWGTFGTRILSGGHIWNAQTYRRHIWKMQNYMRHLEKRRLTEAHLDTQTYAYLGGENLENIHEKGTFGNTHT